MSILIDANTRVVVQGITGRHGRLHTERMLAYGTRIVAGVTPGKKGYLAEGVPVYDTVRQAREARGAEASVIFVPPAGAADAIMEAAEAGIELIVCITEGIPVQDMVRVHHFLRGKACRLLGPNCPGIIVPSVSKVGILPGEICKRGHVGIVSRSGTLTYEAISQLTALGIGQSTAVGIGGDPIKGMEFTDILEQFWRDEETQAIVLIGEIGGEGEQMAAEWLRKNPGKPVVAFVSGVTAPPGRRMGHAGAMISGASGTAAQKQAALREAGAVIVPSPDQIGQTLRAVAEEKRILRALTDQTQEDRVPCFM